MPQKARSGQECPLSVLLEIRRCGTAPHTTSKSKLAFSPLKGVALALPVEHAFSDGVDVTYRDDAYEAEHAPEDGRPLGGYVFFENNSPGNHEDHFQIKKDEKHGHQVELHRKAGLAAAIGEHPALVGDVFGGVALPGAAKDYAGDKRCCCEADGNDDLKKNGQVVFGHDPENLRCPIKGLMRGVWQALLRECLQPKSCITSKHKIWVQTAKAFGSAGKNEAQGVLLHLARLLWYGGDASYPAPENLEPPMRLTPGLLPERLREPQQRLEQAPPERWAEGWRETLNHGIFFRSF